MNTSSFPYARLLRILFTFLGAQLVGSLVALLCGCPIGVSLFAANLLALVAALPSRFTRRSDWSLGTTSRSHSLRLLCAIVLLCAGLNLLSEAAELPDIAIDVIVQVMGHPLGLLTIALLGPLTEEVFFRAGIMGTILDRGGKPWLAIAVSALLFGLIHGNPAQIPFASAVGLALGYAYLQTRSLLIPTLGHVINNGSAVALFLLLGEEQAQELRMADVLGGTLQVILCGLLLTALGAWLLFRPTCKTNTTHSTAA